MARSVKDGRNEKENHRHNMHVDVEGDLVGTQIGQIWADFGGSLHAPKSAHSGGYRVRRQLVRMLPLMLRFRFLYFWAAPWLSAPGACSHVTGNGLIVP
jgi:hypothetical protein